MVYANHRWLNRHPAFKSKYKNARSGGCLGLSAMDARVCKHIHKLSQVFDQTVCLKKIYDMFDDTVKKDGKVTLNEIFLLVQSTDTGPHGRLVTEAEVRKYI